MNTSRPCARQAPRCVAKYLWSPEGAHLPFKEKLLSPGTVSTAREGLALKTSLCLSDPLTSSCVPWRSLTLLTLKLDKPLLLPAN